MGLVVVSLLFIKIKRRLEQMKKDRILITLTLLVLSSCSVYDDAGSSRKHQLAGPEEATAVSKDKQVPVIALEQELKNCVDTPLCRLEPLGAEAEELQINSLIVAEAEALNAQNIADAPTIKFSIDNIDSTDIEAVTYTYIKRDSLQNVIIQSEEKPLIVENGYYSLPIHLSTLGGGIMTSAPYDQHLLSIRIRTAMDKQTYSYNIKFNLLSSSQNPVLLNRSLSIMDSSYYKMDQDLDDFVIDSIELLNTLAYPVTVSGSINVNNSTVAILSNTHHIQNKTFMPHAQYYPWDQYIMTTGTYLEYHQALAAPTYRVLIIRDSGINEELSVTTQAGVNAYTLNFSDLTLQGNEKIRMDLIIHVDTNSSVLGPQGQEPFFEGNTICDNVTITSKCSCFYYTPDKNVQNMVIYGPTLCGAYMNNLNNLYYPNCNDPQPGYCLQKFLDIVYYPQNLLTLVGRDHRTDASYSITSWLKGYEALEELGSSTRSFDTIQVTKGYINYSSINPSLSYTGYIPGHVE